MELFLDTEDDARLSLAAIIEWDIPGLECTETIGLWFAVDNTLIDYDGVSSLPIEAIEFLRAQGYIVPKEFE
jgi:hypothetical protein